MLASLLIYYVLSIIYLIVCFVLRRPDVFLKAMILIGCPFIGTLILFYMMRNASGKSELPNWLLKREQYTDFSLQSPNRLEEVNVIPFQDALTLNDNKTKRKTLIGLLKKDFIHKASALELALQSADTETSHYAATALQDSKSKLMKQMRSLEAQLVKNEQDAEVLLDYLDVLKQAVQMEFLDLKTRRKYMYTYFHTLSSYIRIQPFQSPSQYGELITTALDLGEYEAACQTANDFLERFPHEEDAYFSMMHVHYQMANTSAFYETVEQLRNSGAKLSPERLKQLRFWLPGEDHE